MERKMNTSLEVTIDHDVSMSRSPTPRAPFFKIFLKVLKESHMAVSIISETLKPFPRFIRTILLFTEVYIELLLSCIFACLWGSYKGIDFISLWVVTLSQILVILLGNINRTSNKALTKAKNTGEFIEIS